MDASNKNKDAKQTPASPVVDEEKFRVFRRNRASPSSYFNLMLVINLFVAQDMISVSIVHFPYFTKYVTLLSLFMVAVAGWVLYYLKRVISDEALMLYGYSLDYISQCKDSIVYVEDFFVYVISFAAGMMVIFRTSYGECGDLPSILTTTTCNPEHACGWIPSDITAVTLLVPLFIKVILKGASWKATRLSICIVVSMILYAIVMSSAYQSLYLVIICVPFIVMMLFEMRRQNVEVFLLTESLLASLEDNERMAEEMRLNEMKMMIGNVAHDLKTPLTAFLSGLEDVDSICREMKSLLKKMFSRKNITFNSNPRQITCIHNSTDSSNQNKSSKGCKAPYDIMMKASAFNGIEKIKKSVQTSKNINSFMLMSINRCIDFTKVKHGVNLKSKMETFCLKDVLDVPLNCMRELQSAVDICLCHIPATICTHIITDRQWFQENILCLASNAVKYSNKGTVTIKICLWSPSNTDTSNATTTGATTASTPSVGTTPVISWKEDKSSRRLSTIHNNSNNSNSNSNHYKKQSSSSPSYASMRSSGISSSASSHSNKDNKLDRMNESMDDVIRRNSLSCKQNQHQQDKDGSIKSMNESTHSQLARSRENSMRFNPNENQSPDKGDDDDGINNSHRNKPDLTVFHESDLLIIGDSINNHHTALLSGCSSPGGNYYNNHHNLQQQQSSSSSSSLQQQQGAYQANHKNRISSRRNSFNYSPVVSTKSSSNGSTLHCTIAPEDGDNNNNNINHINDPADSHYHDGEAKLMTRPIITHSDSIGTIRSSNYSNKAQVSPRGDYTTTSDINHHNSRSCSNKNNSNTSSNTTNNGIMNTKRMERERSYNLLTSLNIITNTTSTTSTTFKGVLSSQSKQRQQLKPPMYLRVEVEDQGIGIPEETMETLFSPFKQAQRLAGGTGLGLFSLAKRLEGLNGYYGVQKRSDGQQGSLFWFAFPYQPDKEMAKSYLAEKLEREREKEKDDSTVSSTVYTSDDSTSREGGTGGGVDDEDSLFSKRTADDVMKKSPRLNDKDDDKANDEAFDTIIVGAAVDGTYDNHSIDDADDDNHTNDDNDDDDDDYSSDDDDDQADSARQDFSNLSILLVDDSLPILKMLTNMLKGQGHTVVTAANGAESLDRLAEQHAAHNGAPFDLILMDMQMPVMDGLEATRRIRSMEVERAIQQAYKQPENDGVCIDNVDVGNNSNNFYHRQNILALSANSDDDTIAGAFAVGVDEFMPKPFAIKSLYDKLRIIRNKTTVIKSKIGFLP